MLRLKDIKENFEIIQTTVNGNKAYSLYRAEPYKDTTYIDYCGTFVHPYLGSITLERNYVVYFFKDINGERVGTACHNIDELNAEIDKFICYAKKYRITTDYAQEMMNEKYAIEIAVHQFAKNIGYESKADSYDIGTLYFSNGKDASNLPLLKLITDNMAEYLILTLPSGDCITITPKSVYDALSQIYLWTNIMTNTELTGLMEKSNNLAGFEGIFKHVDVSNTKAYTRDDYGLPKEIEWKDALIEKLEKIIKTLKNN